MIDIIAVTIAYLIVGGLCANLAFYVAIAFCYFVCPRRSLSLLEWLILYGGVMRDELSYWFWNGLLILEIGVRRFLNTFAGHATVAMGIILLPPLSVFGLLSIFLSGRIAAVVGVCTLVGWMLILPRVAKLITSRPT